MTCPHCQFAEVPDGARFCPICGERLAPPDPQPAEPERPAGAQLNVRTQVGQGEATGVRINQVEQLVINNPSPQQVQAAVQMAQIPTALEPASTGLHIDDATRERLAAMEEHLKQLTDQLNRADTPTRQVDAVQVGGVEVSRVDLLLKRAILLRTEANEAMSKYVDSFGEFSSEEADALGKETTEKLSEALAILTEARSLAPQNVDVLLHLARVLGDEGADAFEIRSVLGDARRLVEPPANDDQRFQLAQVLYLLAVADEDDIKTKYLEEARDIFERLRREEWVALCESKLAEQDESDADADDGWTPNVPPSETPESSTSWLSRILNPTATNQNPPIAPTPGVPQPPQPLIFNPVGRWQVNVTDGTSWVLDLIFGGGLQGQGGNMFTGVQAVGGQWGFNPYTNTLQIAGFTGGVIPFNVVLSIQGQEGTIYHAFGSDGHRYTLQRMM